ncbi:MAG: type II secretion system protein [Candidatus Moranbacteria bacterium]|nr:type II secretion system protein [Candidatus Moranbacteria bacterium]
MRKNSRRGFTLIELLIVIAIIGILSSVILVSLTSSRKRSAGAAFKTTMSTLKGAVALCCADSTNVLRTVTTATGTQTVCVTSTGTAVGTSYLPTATELNLGTGTASYAGNIVGYRCSNANPILRVRVANDSKNPACSITATSAIYYYVGANDISYGMTATPTAASIKGFPPGC